MTLPHSSDNPQQLTIRRRQVRDYIVGLALQNNPATEAFREKVVATLSAYDMELERKQKGFPGSTEWFEQIEALNLMALLLLSQHLQSRKIRAEPWNAEDRRLTRFLFFAIDEFNLAHNDLANRFPVPDLTVVTTATLWSRFFDMTLTEAQHDAHDLRAQIEETRATTTLEEIEAKMKAIRARRRARRQLKSQLEKQNKPAQ